MKTISGFLIAGVVLVLLGGCWLLSQHGSMVALNEVVKQDWTDLDAQLQRREDLIPDLVSAVRDYTPSEEDVFTDLSNARGKLTSAATPKTTGLGRLLALAGSHPELTADESFFRLRKELADVERSIADARRNYNEHVDLYNMCIDQVPGSFLASGMGLLPRERFEPPRVPAGESVTAAPDGAETGE